MCLKSLLDSQSWDACCLECLLLSSVLPQPKECGFCFSLTLLLEEDKKRETKKWWWKNHLPHSYSSVFVGSKEERVNFFAGVNSKCHFPEDRLSHKNPNCLPLENYQFLLLKRFYWWVEGKKRSTTLANRLGVGCNFFLLWLKWHRTIFMSKNWTPHLPGWAFWATGCCGCGRGPEKGRRGVFRMPAEGFECFSSLEPLS